jgi:phosphopantetheinyl transferase/acyl carrier protein
VAVPGAPAVAPARAPEPANAAALTAGAISDLLLKIVADRTGYPVDMIDIDLDLEADLGVDSIKRVEILGSLQQQTGLMQENDMESLAGRKTLRQVSEFLANRGEAPREKAPVAPPAPPRSAAAAPAPAAPGPLVGRIVSHEPGRRLVAVREVGLEEDRFLRDHILGRDHSTLTGALSGLPVMPLTMSMEVLAEAAATLVPGRRLVGMRDVRAYRWMALEGEKLTLRVVASAKPDTDGREVWVQAFDADAPGGAAPTPIVEGTMVMADVYPTPPAAAAPFALAGERPSKWAPADMYRTGMFHGPAFRGVVSMDRWGQDGAEATLRTLPADELFASTRRPPLVTDPVLMDQPGQVVGLWTAEHLDTGFVVFPFQLEALHLYAEPPAAHRSLKCQARIALVGEQQVRSDLDVVDEQGRVMARLTGWWDRRFDLPRSFLAFLQSPREGVLGRPWPSPAPAGGAAGLQAWRLGTDDFPEAFFTSHGGVWQRVLALTALSRAEQEAWRALRTPEPRRVEWLLGRLAGKCAVRAFLEARHGLRLSPAEVEIVPDADGRPVAGGAWTRDVPAPILSLSHAGGVAVAVVGDGTAAAGVGVDVEQAGRLGEDADRVAFTAGEQALLAALDEEGREAWRLRLWCAKEAVAKAVGLGLLGGPRSFVAEDLDAAAGTVRIRLTGEMVSRRPDVDGKTLVAHTARERDLVVATSLYTAQ